MSRHGLDADQIKGAMRTYDRIAAAWGLTEQERMELIGIGAGATAVAEPESVLSDDVVTRLSHILGIFKVLQILLPDADVADRWLRKPDTAPLFGGRSALSMMLAEGEQGLLKVRQHLDAQLA